MNVNASIRNSFEREMIWVGYKIYKATFPRESALRMFQKGMKKSNSTKYYLNVYHYNFKEQGFVDESDKDRYEITAQFIKNTLTVDIDYSMGSQLPNLKEVEEFFERIFINNKFDYSEKSNLYLSDYI